MKRATCILGIAMVAMTALSLGSAHVAHGQTVDPDNWTVQSPYATQRQTRSLNLPYIGPSLSTRRTSPASRPAQYLAKTFDYDWNTSAITVAPFTNDQVSTLSERHSWYMPGSNLLRGQQGATNLFGDGDTTGVQQNIGGLGGGGVLGGLFGVDGDDADNGNAYQWAVRPAAEADATANNAPSATRPSPAAGQLPARQWRPPSSRRIILPFGGEAKQGEYNVQYDVRINY